jgi:hypothetical protein
MGHRLLPLLYIEVVRDFVCYDCSGVKILGLRFSEERKLLGRQYRPRGGVGHALSESLIQDTRLRQLIMTSRTRRVIQPLDLLFQQQTVGVLPMLST